MDLWADSSRGRSGFLEGACRLEQFFCGHSLDYSPFMPACDEESVEWFGEIGSRIRGE